MNYKKEIKKALWVCFKIWLGTKILMFLLGYFIYSQYPELSQIDIENFNAPYMGLGAIMGVSFCLWFSWLSHTMDSAYPCYGKDLCEGVVEREYPVKVRNLKNN